MFKTRIAVSGAFPQENEKKKEKRKKKKEKEEKMLKRESERFSSDCHCSYWSFEI